MQASEPACPSLELRLREGEIEATGTAEGDVDAARRRELRREAGPAIRRAPGPGGVLRHAEPFALHPDQSEIAARGAIGMIALIEYRDTLPEPRQPPCQSGA